MAANVVRRARSRDGEVFAVDDDADKRIVARQLKLAERPDLSEDEPLLVKLVAIEG